MNKERDPEKEMEISARIAKASAREKERENRHKLVEEDRLTAEASGSALHKDQSRYEKYLYVPPHQRTGDSPEEAEGSERRRTGQPPPRPNNGFAPHHDDRDRFRDAPHRGRRPPRGGRRGGRGRDSGGHPHQHPHPHQYQHQHQHPHQQAPQDQKWLDERVMADSARLESNKTVDGQWKREFDRGKKIPFASTRHINEDDEYAPGGPLRSNRGRGGPRRAGGPREAPSHFRGGRGRGGATEGRQIQLEDDAVTVTVNNEGAGRGRGPRSARGASRSSESSVEAAGDPPQGGRPRGGRGPEGGRRSGGRRWTRRGRGGRSGRGGRPSGRGAPPQMNGKEEEEEEEPGASVTNGAGDAGLPIGDVGPVDDAEVEDEYIDDTLEDLEDLDQYRLKIDLNEFTVDNPDLPDPILKKPMEFSWARAVSEEEKCQARGEMVPLYSGPVEVVWYDELEGEKSVSSSVRRRIPEEAEPTDNGAESEKEVADFECRANEGDSECQEKGEELRDSPERIEGQFECQGDKSELTMENHDVTEEKKVSKDDCNEERDGVDDENDSPEEVREEPDCSKNEETFDSAKDIECADKAREEKPPNSQTDVKSFDSSDNLSKEESPEIKEKIDASNLGDEIAKPDSNSVKNDVSDSGTTLESDHLCSDT